MTAGAIRSSARKRYNWRLIWLSLLYCLFLLPAVYGFKHQLIPNGLKYLIAILPAVPVVGLFAAMGRYLVEEPDEYVRMLRVREMLWAMGFTLSCATIWGFLDNFGLVGHVDGYWIVVLWYFGQAIGAAANRLTLGASTC